MLKFVLASLFFISTVFSSTSFADNESRQETLRIGMPAQEWAPFWGGVDNPSGLYHSLINSVAESMNVELEYVGYNSLNDIYTALEQNQIDASFGFVRNSDRENRFLFTAPIVKLKKVVWLRDKALKERPFSEWRWVCVTNGIDCNIIPKLGGINIHSSDSNHLLEQLIKQGEADAVLTTLMEIDRYIEDPLQSKGRVLIDKNIGEVGIGLMLAKNKLPLKKQINKTIKDNQLALKGTRLANIHLLNDSAQWQLLQNQQKSNTIRYTIADNVYPLSYRDPNTGRVQGYVHDLLKILSSKTLFRFEFVPANGRDVEQMLEDGIVDLLPAHSTYNVEDSKMLATKPYTATHYSFMKTRLEFEERQLGVLNSINALCANINYIKMFEPVRVFDTPQALLHAMQSGEVTHALVNRDLVANYIAGQGDKHFQMVPKPNYLDFTTPISMVVRDDSVLLHKSLSRMLSIITPAEIELLQQAHNKVVITYGYDKETVNDYLVWLGIFSIFLAIAIACGFYRLSRHLKKSHSVNKLSQREVHWLSTLLDNLPNMIVITNMQGQVVFTNRAYETLINSCDCPHGRISIDTCAFTMRVLEQFSSSTFQYPNRCAMANRYFHVTHQTINHPDHSGLPHRMTVISDVSEDKLKEEELQRSNQRAIKAVEARNEFLAIVSHELRTPIAAMLGLMELLQLSLRKRQDIELLKNTIQSAERLKSQVNEILDFSKIEANQLQIDVRRHNLYQELCPTLRSYETAAKLKGLSYSLNWKPSAVIHADFDALRINQVIGNLLSNALKFTENGHISVEIETTASCLRIMITDTGCGMKDDQLKHIFTPFEQAHKGITRRYGGTGLGMSICKNLVELMDGQIAISSKIKQGTSVEINIPITVVDEVYNCEFVVQPSSPRAQQWIHAWQGCHIESDLPLIAGEKNCYPDQIFELCQQGDNHPKPAKALTLPSSKGKVLVVDDDGINRMLIRNQLALIGVDFHIVDTAKNAYDYLVRYGEHVSLLITDCHMPEMDGFQLTQAVKQLSAVTGEIPVIGCTAEDSRVVSEKAEKCGMDSVLYKPYSLEELYNVLERYLVQKPELTAENDGLDEHLDWLFEHPVEQQDEMATVVISSFEDECRLLADNNEDCSAIIHRIKGSAALLGMHTLVTLAKQYETTNDIQQKKQLKLDVICELNVVQDKLKHWLTNKGN